MRPEAKASGYPIVAGTKKRWGRVDQLNKCAGQASSDEAGSECVWT